MKKFDESSLFEVRRMSHSAHAFLNGFEVLKPHNWMAGLDLLPLEQRKYIRPADFVCLAFSVEVGLKTLLKFFHDKTPRAHGLYELYTMLPQNCQDDVFNAMTPHYSHADIFMKLLKDNQDAFTRWRYSYEPNENELSINPDFLQSLSKAILAVVSKYYKQAKESLV